MGWEKIGMGANPRPQKPEACQPPAIFHFKFFSFPHPMGKAGMRATRTGGLSASGNTPFQALLLLPSHRGRLG